jgi:hypothetical protein
MKYSEQQRRTIVVTVCMWAAVLVFGLATAVALWLGSVSVAERQQVEQSIQRYSGGQPVLVANVQTGWLAEEMAWFAVIRNNDGTEIVVEVEAHPRVPKRGELYYLQPVFRRYQHASCWVIGLGPPAQEAEADQPLSGGPDLDD